MNEIPIKTEKKSTIPEKIITLNGTLFETNSAQLPDSVVSTWVDVRLCGEDVSEPILRDCTVGVESVHGEGDTGVDVFILDLVGVVGRHCPIALKSNGSID